MLPKFIKNRNYLKVLYTNDPLDEGSIFTLRWDNLKKMVEADRKGTKVIGFRVSEIGIDVVHEETMTFQKGSSLIERIIYGNLKINKLDVPPSAVLRELRRLKKGEKARFSIFDVDPNVIKKVAEGLRKRGYFTYVSDDELVVQK
jgi:hypothetical protein